MVIYIWFGFIQVCSFCKIAVYSVTCLTMPMSCRGGHLEFLTDTKKKKHFRENHPKKIPANFSVKLFKCFREEEI